MNSSRYVGDETEEEKFHYDITKMNYIKHLAINNIFGTDKEGNNVEEVTYQINKIVTN